MKTLINLLNLQLFAEGGDGGSGGAADGAAQGGAGESVVNPADDGQARLLELGVPANKIR